MSCISCVFYCPMNSYIFLKLSFILCIFFCDVFRYRDTVLKCVYFYAMGLSIRQSLFIFLSKKLLIIRLVTFSPNFQNGDTALALRFKVTHYSVMKLCSDDTIFIQLQQAVCVCVCVCLSAVDNLSCECPADSKIVSCIILHATCIH